MHMPIAKTFSDLLTVGSRVYSSPSKVPSEVSVLWSAVVSGSDRHLKSGRIAPLAAVMERDSSGEVQIHFQRYEGAVGRITVNYELIGSVRLQPSVNFIAASGQMVWEDGEFGCKYITAIIPSIPNGFSMLTCKLTPEAAQDTVRQPYCYIKFENGNTPDSVINTSGYEVNNITGDDSNAGTVSAPLASISKAAELSNLNSSRRIIRVANTGTPYQELGKGSGTIGGGVNFYSVNGNEANPLVVTPYAGERVTVDQQYQKCTGSTADAACFYLSGCSYIFLNRFDCTHAPAGVYFEEDAQGAATYCVAHDFRAVNGGSNGVVASNIACYRMDSSRYCIISKSTGCNWYTAQAQGADIYTNSGLHLAVGVTGFDQSNVWIDACHFYHLLRGIYLKQHARDEYKDDPGYYCSRNYWHDCLQGPVVDSAGAGNYSPKECLFANNVGRNCLFAFSNSSNVGDSPLDQGGPVELVNNCYLGGVIDAAMMGETAGSVGGSVTIAAGNLSSFQFHETAANVPSGQTWIITLPLRSETTFNDFGESWFTFKNTGDGTLIIRCNTGQAYPDSETDLSLSSGSVTTVSMMSTSYLGSGNDWWTLPASAIAGVSISNMDKSIFYSNYFGKTTVNVVATVEPETGGIGYVNNIEFCDYNNYSSDVAGSYILNKDGPNETAYNLTSWRGQGYDVNSTQQDAVFRNAANGDYFIENITARFGRVIGIDDLTGL